MSEEDRKEFVIKWHEAVQLELDRQSRKQDVKSVGVALLESLEDNPPIARLGSNPLLCAMICALHKDRGQKVPESQSELCEALCQMLLHRREREAGLPIEGYGESYKSLTYPQKKILVKDLAHNMALNGESNIPIDSADKLIGRTLNQIPSVRPDQASDIRRTLVERSGLIRESGRDAVSFIHNTLKEYLAAEKFIDQEDLGLLAKHVDDPSWKPIVIFAAASGKQGVASTLIKKILENKQPGRGQKKRDEVLRRGRLVAALQCRAVAVTIEPELQSQLKDIEKVILPPKTAADAEALAAAGENVLSWLKHRRLSAVSARASVRALRLIGTPRAKQYLRAYLKDERPLVVSELCLAVNPLEISAVRKQIINRKQLDHISGRELFEWKKRITDLAPIESDIKTAYELDISYTKISDISLLQSATKLSVRPETC